MMLELGVGDSYGLGFEYCDANLHLNDLSGYVRRPINRRMNWPEGIGKYSDDTQMSIAIAELLIEGAEWTYLNIANKFVECFKRDPIVGYAKGFYHFLKQVKDGQDFLDNIIPISDKSGAAMRATPIGIINNIDVVINYATIQAELTHNTVAGIDSAVASALCSYFFIHEKGNPKDLPTFIANHVHQDDEYKWDKPYEGKVGPKGHMSVRAAITAIARNNSLSECLIDCVNFSGDVDTVATIAMAAASCSEYYKKDLPDCLIYGLRNDKFGREYLENLDKNLSLLKDVTML